MRSWVVAVVLSLALHLALVAAFRVEALPPTPPRGERVGERGDTFVSFTPVTVVERKKALVSPLPRGGEGARGASDVRSDVRSDVQPDVTSGEVEASGEGAGSSEPAPERSESAVGVEPADPGPGPELIALVHARLAALADRCYPAAARRFQQRGTVQLAFCTDAAGGTASSSITQSSGASLLDAAARGCVIEQAAPFPPQAASRCFSVPVRFGAR